MGNTVPEYPDGCSRPNIALKPYRILFRPVCGHKAIRGAIVIILAESLASAREEVSYFLTIPGNEIVSITPVEAVAERVI